MDKTTFKIRLCPVEIDTGGIKMTKITVYCEKHYNKFLRIEDYKLTSDSNKFPLSAYADTIDQAKELCNHLLGLNNWKLEGETE